MENRRMKIKQTINLFAAGVLTAMVISGCANRQPQMYYWGEYEALIYDMYVEAGTAEADVQIEKLTADIDKASNAGKRVPPGVYAHLGFMYASKGNVNLAVEAFNQEKALFPESAKFIDGMMDRAFKGRKS